MRYAMDLERLSIRDYKNILKRQNLLPGRKILLQNIDEHFAWFEKKGITSVAQLMKNLSSPRKIASLSAESGIAADYGVVLNREMNSLKSKPVLLASYPDVDPSFVESLRKIGVKNSKDYWERNISVKDELFCLCDLVRINGVGPVASKAFYEAGYRSVSDVAEADAALMLERISAVNEIRHYYKAKLGIKDMQFCIDSALLLEKYCDDTVKKDRTEI